MGQWARWTRQLLKFLALTGLGLVLVITSPSFDVTLSQSLYDRESATPSRQLKEQAQKFVVYVRVPGDSGSGVIIRRESTIYTVITAYHVVKSIRVSSNNPEEIQTPLEEAYLVTSDDINHVIKSIRKLPSLDLAVVTFSTEKLYPTAKFPNINRITNSNLNSQETVYVFGYPTVNNPRSRRFEMKTGQITGDARSDKREGYWMFYRSNTTAGMSGGGVLNSKGELVGIHGGVTSDKQRLGLAIPIRLFIRPNGSRWEIASSYDPSNLKLGEEIRFNSILTSNNSCFKLTLQGDGNLVLYDNVSNKSLWSSGTENTAVRRVIFQEDGNFVLTDSSRKPIWSTNTHGLGAVGLQIQDDGNVVLYRSDGVPVWSTGTSAPQRVHQSCNLPKKQDSETGTSRNSSTLALGREMRLGSNLRSPNKCFRLAMQEDGNLVLYDRYTNPLWDSQTGGKGARRVIFQGDGNLVLVNESNTPLWNSRTNNTGVTRLQLQNDGNLVLYRTDGSPTWSTNTATTEPMPNKC